MINDILEKIELHRNRAKKAILEIKAWKELALDAFSHMELILEKIIEYIILKNIK